MNQRWICYGVPAALTVCALAGCAKPSVVGSWQGQAIVPGQPAGATVLLTFRPAGTVTQSLTSAVGSFALDGTYTVTGDKIKVDVTGLKANGVPVPQSVTSRMPPSIFHVTSTYKLDGNALTITELDAATGAATARTMTLKRTTDEAK